MLKRLAVFGLIVGLGLGVGCTSSNKEGEDVDVAAAEGEAEAGDVPVESLEDGSVASDESTDEFSGEEGMADNSGGQAENSAPDEDFGEDPLLAGEGAGQDLAATPDPMPAESTPTEPAPVDSGLQESPPISEPSTSYGGGWDSEEPPRRVMVTLKKIVDVPYRKSRILLNAVYVARPGDTLSSVAKKIFGDEAKKKDLLKANSFLSRGVKTGDKIYYNSPQRPEDSERLLTFYEDAGLAPEVYTSAAGESIRDIAKRLLGDREGWKELWATNLDVESKDVLPEGTRLRYWTATDIAAAPPATAGAGQGMDAGGEPPPPANDGFVPPEMNTPPPPSDSMAMNDNSVPPPPPPPAVDDFDSVPPPPASAGFTEPPPPPPPPPAQMAPKPSSGSAMSADMEDPDQMMMLAAAAVLILASVMLFVIIRKKRSRRGIDFNTATHTQIE